MTALVGELLSYDLQTSGQSGRGLCRKICGWRRVMEKEGARFT